MLLFGIVIFGVPALDVRRRIMTALLPAATG
jgi:hypothetical protein